MLAVRTYRTALSSELCSVTSVPRTIGSIRAARVRHICSSSGAGAGTVTAGDPDRNGEETYSQAMRILRFSAGVDRQRLERAARSVAGSHFGAVDPPDIQRLTHIGDVADSAICDAVYRAAVSESERSTVKKGPEASRRGTGERRVRSRDPHEPTPRSGSDAGQCNR